MPLKTLDISLELLGYFTAHHPSWGVREMSQQTGLSPSAVQRIMSTLAKKGFLRQQPETRRYELGVRFWELGVLYRDRLQLCDAPATWLQEVALGQGETVYLNFLENRTAVCVQVAKSREHVQLNINPGERTPLHLGSRGKAMLAFLPRDQQMAILEDVFAPKSGADRETRKTALQEDLKNVQSSGFSISRSERLSDVVGLSFPILDIRNLVIGSVTIGGPNSRMTDSKLNTCLPVIKQLSNKLQDHFRNFL